MQCLVLTLPAVPCFFSSCFFILVFTPIFLYKRIWAFVGQIMLTGSKGSWTQFVFICWSHSVEELYSAANLHSVANLYSASDRFSLHLFLWTFLALWSSWWAFGPYFSLDFPLYGLLSLASYWAFFLMGFWVQICKNGHQQLSIKYCASLNWFVWISNNYFSTQNKLICKHAVKCIL